MIRSYRLWSAVMGAWYLVAVASLVTHPPGSESKISTSRGRVSVPEHATFFQAALSWQFWAAVLGVGGALLMGTAALCWRLLPHLHLALMVAAYVFGIGYVINALQQNTAWLAGGFALVAAAGHLLIGRLRTSAVVADSFAGGAA